MTLDLQFKLKSNPLYIEYLHLNSYWYKILNRNPLEFNRFIEEVKDYYHLRPMDRVKRVIDTMDFISNVLSTIK